MAGQTVATAQSGAALSPFARQLEHQVPAHRIANERYALKSILLVHSDALLRPRQRTSRSDRASASAHRCRRSCACSCEQRCTRQPTLAPRCPGCTVIPTNLQAHEPESPSGILVARHPAANRNNTSRGCRLPGQPPPLRTRKYMETRAVADNCRRWSAGGRSIGHVAARRGAIRPSTWPLSLHGFHFGGIQGSRRLESPTTQS